MSVAESLNACREAGNGSQRDILPRDRNVLAALASSPEQRPLTARQAFVLQTIREFIDSDGYPPTLRQLMERTGIRSTNGITDHLRALERKGWIVRDAWRSRGMRLVVAGTPGSPLPPAPRTPGAFIRPLRCDCGAVTFAGRCHACAAGGYS